MTLGDEFCLSAGRPSRPAGPLSICTIDPSRLGIWDGLLQRFPTHTVFHSEGWARLLATFYGHTPFYLAAMKANGAEALLPIMEVSSPLTGRRGVALPFSDECAALCADGRDASVLFHHALELAKKRNWAHLEVRGEIPGLDSVAASRADLVGHTLELSVGPDALFARLEPSVRRAIRKAKRCGVRVTQTTSMEGVDRYYALHCVTRRKHGVPPQSRGFFRAIVEQLFDAGHGFIMEARHAGRLLAAAIFLHYGCTAVYKFGASHPAHLSLRANDLVMWEAIEWLSTRGFSRLSMGRSATSNEGLRRFKRGFGTTEALIPYYRYDLRRAEFVALLAEKENWTNRVLQFAPLPLFRMLGRAAYPHLD
jgi:CelD/BcsL family acetyltransferase involved in cellulose biosynthesis